VTPLPPALQNQADRPTVTRCVCIGVTLAEVRAIAAREGLDADGVMERTGCGGPGGGCGLCAPYIRAAIALGVDEVPLANPASLEVMIRTARRRVGAAVNDNGPGVEAPGPSIV
jgi:bacterioferritin-associated ferredoxin